MRWAVAPLALVPVVVSCTESVIPLRAPKYIEMVSGDRQISPVGSSFAQPLTVRVFDVDSVPLAGRRVDFRVAVGEAEIASQSVDTDAGGLAQSTVTPSSAGTIHVIASVFSTGLSERFILAGAGPGSAIACDDDNTLRMSPAQVRLDVGGGGVCIASRDSAATFVLLVFNAPAADGSYDSASVTIDASGTEDPPVPFTAIQPAVPSARATSGGDADPAFRPRWPASAARRDLTTSPARARGVADMKPAVDTVGQLRQLNVNFSSDCDIPVYRTGRVMGVTERATIVLDVSSPTQLDTAGVRELGAAFDDLVVPAVAGNFLYPADIDSSGRVTLFITDAVNDNPALARHPLVAFARRDLMATTACPGSNQSELLYVSVPGTQLSQDQLLDSLPRHLAHSLQHLINASRRIYENDAQRFEESWLDEGLSQVAEEAAFHRAGSWASRLNLNALHLTFTRESRIAFRRLQSGNAGYYREFLASVSTSSPISSGDGATTRGGSWSLLRYLVDRRAGTDYVLWTRLANSTLSGLDNLTEVFGPKLAFETRDWALSLLTDDLFMTTGELQQPSWNFRSIFSALGVQPYPLELLPLTPANPIAVTLAPAGAAFSTFSIPANGVAAISWSGAPAPSLSPMVMWALVRIR